MDISPNLSDVITIGLFTLTSWATIRNGINKRLTQVEGEQGRFDERITHVEEYARASQDLGAQISALSAKLDDLRADVAKHNNVIERTFKLETRMDAAMQDIEDMKSDKRIGGTL